MINHNIYLHSEVKTLIEKYIQGRDKIQYSSPELFAKYIIENKSKSNNGFSDEEKIFAGLIGDSFDVKFTGNTNTKSYGHANLSKEINGSIIANVAPDLSVPLFQNIFLFKDGNFTVPDLFKDFYKNKESEELNEYSLNLFAYKQHFKIWAENNIAAATIHGAKKIVVPGMGLGIYAGPLNGKYTELQRLGDIQFEILKEIAEKNTDIQIVFCGLGEKSENIGQNSNIEGRCFNDIRSMVNEEEEKVMRVVAGSLNIQLGGGGGDNAQIKKDTNIATLQKSNKTIKIYSDNLHNPTIIDVQYFLSKLNDTITSLVDDGKMHKISIEKNNYTEIKAALRKLKEWNFQKLNKNTFNDLISVCESLEEELKKQKNNLSPTIIEIITEFLKDMKSLISRFLGKNLERNWANSIKSSKEKPQLQNFKS